MGSRSPRRFLSLVALAAALGCGVERARPASASAPDSAGAVRAAVGAVEAGEGPGAPRFRWAVQLFSRDSAGALVCVWPLPPAGETGWRMHPALVRVALDLSARVLGSGADCADAVNRHRDRPT